MNRLLIPIGALGALALGLMVAFALGALASASSAGGEAIAAGGLAEDVGVHGAWQIDIVDPDGTLARHLEFHNDLTAEGRAALADLLAREVAIGVKSWQVSLWGATTWPCQNIAGTGFPCMLVEPGDLWGPADLPRVFQTLSIEVTTSSSVLLRGSAIAGRDGDIGRVVTHLETCGGCFIAVFTEAAINPAAPVVAGQQIQVTVEFSFVTAP